MRSNLIFIFILLAFYMRAQSPFNGIDSTRNIRWENDISMFFATADGNDSLVPSNYVRTEFDLKQQDGFVVIICGQTSPIYKARLTVPQKCIYKEKVSGNIVANVSSPIKGKDTIPPPDSITQVDQTALEQFYIDKKDSLVVDTLWVSADKVFDMNEFSNYHDKLDESSYKYNRKDGIERYYYKTAELKDVCITDNFRLKYEGHWKAGKKNGKWKEYDKSGKLISVKKYRHDRLVREKSY